MKYDYLVVGAGLFGAVFAHEMAAKGKDVLVIDRREHIGGNIYTENKLGINVHKYGAHIFHTSDKEVWEYVNRFAEFNNYINSPVAVYGEHLVQRLHLAHRIAHLEAPAAGCRQVLVVPVGRQLVA